MKQFLKELQELCRKHDAKIEMNCEGFDITVRGIVAEVSCVDGAEVRGLYIKENNIMKKEVVHVPTYELAKEVLRVVRSSGLYNRGCLQNMITKVRQEDLCLEIGEHYGFDSIGYFTSKGYKVITAQEFLSRYKSKFKPIAMKCTQEQFDEIKGKLYGLGNFGSLYKAFSRYNYLTNYYGKTKMYFDFINRELPTFKNVEEVFEEWNEKTFLEYCGIEVKEEVEEYIGEIDDLVNYNTKLLKENERLKVENKDLLEDVQELLSRLKAIEDQPKVGDVCLFWDKGDMTGFYVDILIKVMDNSNYKYRIRNGAYANCIKATPENIQAKIKELTNK